jgi:NADH-quinone oxidoreductase subunit G
MGFVTIDGQKIEIQGEKNILSLVRKAGIELPTFCYFSELSVYGACRMCVVEIEGRGVVASCSTPPEDGMIIRTSTERTLRVRRTVLELLLANHDRDCTTCEKSGNCKLQELSFRFGIRNVRFGEKEDIVPIDDSSPSIIRDPNKCILCGDCVRVCSEIQGIGAIDLAARGPETVVTPAFGKNLADVECVNCGQCVAVCPTGAMTAKSETDFVWEALQSPTKKVVVQVAPAVRVSLGECFGMGPGQIVTGKIVTALKKLGFYKVFDTVFAADLTAVEECHEFLDRLENRKNLPQFTSCCPGWVKYVEQYHPDMLDNLSTCKSPQQMFGAVAKRFYSERMDIDQDDLVVVSIMPCTAKKFEAKRKEFRYNGRQEVDAVLTVNELALLIKQGGIVFDELEEEAFDQPLGLATGAGTIFGVTGGVSEAVLRTAASVLGVEVGDVEYKEVRGTEGIRETTVDLGGNKVRLAVVHGLGNAKKLIQAIQNEEVEYDLVEVMACPGGCIGGGGEPCPNDTRAKEKRSKALYKADRMMQLRSPMDNIAVMRLYEDILGSPGSQVAHESLHTEYRPRYRISGQEIPKDDRGALQVAVCVGTGCYLRGSYDVLQSLQKLVRREGLENRVELKVTFCLERCDKGVSIRVGDRIVTNVTPQNVEDVFEREIASVNA